MKGKCCLAVSIEMYPCLCHLSPSFDKGCIQYVHLFLCQFEVVNLMQKGGFNFSNKNFPYGL